MRGKEEENSNPDSWKGSHEPKDPAQFQQLVAIWHPLDADSYMHRDPTVYIYERKTITLTRTCRGAPARSAAF
jgi:hypothetical protein